MKSQYDNAPLADKKNADCIVTYKNNTNAGTATVTLTGVNAYSGTVTKTFKIMPFSVNTDPDDWFTVSISDDSYPYAKGGVKPEPEVRFRGGVLTPGVDYTVSYSSNTTINYGTGKNVPTVKVTGKGNFKGTDFSAKFKIIPKPLETSGVEVLVQDVVYQNKPDKWIPKFTVLDSDGKALKAGKDYIVKEAVYSYDAAGLNPIEPKTVVPADTVIYVTVKAKDGSPYTGKAVGSCRVVQSDIGKLSVKAITKIYTGKPIFLSEEDIVWKSGKKEVNDVEYTIDIETYKNNNKKGKATVVVRGTGNYGGTKTITFTIGANKINWWWKDFFKK